MADIASNALGQILADGLRRVGSAIKRQISYLCRFTTYINDLQNEGRMTEATTQHLQGIVDRARDNLLVINQSVEDWLKDSSKLKAEADRILGEAANVGSGCSKFRARFQLSKRAKKATDSMKELRERGKFDRDSIAQPGPPAATVAIPTGTTYEFESRKQIEEDIMTSLIRRDVNMMGICGVGGLGKTVMAKRIMNKTLEMKLFDEVVIAAVSQTVDKLKLQLEIAGSLGLKLEGENCQSREQKLQKRLSGTKSILLVLDDVWEVIKLRDVGIPENHKGCTIIITSRNSDVVKEMNVQKIFGMEVLSNEDAWFLFRLEVGECVDDNAELISIAKEVVNECKGLPIALTTVGAALKDETRMAIWKDRRRLLRNSDPSIPGFLKEVYNPLKLSFDVLESNLQAVFLLCCLFREDADIPLETLTYFCMGLGIFEGTASLEDARNSMFSLTEMLKCRHLLLHSRDDHVRMHDVVRDVCIFIAKQKKCIGGSDCTWISSSHCSELSTRSATFPNLHLLFLIGDSEFKLDSNLLDGVKDLFVLSIERLPLKSLQHTTQSLKNLCSLVLQSCYGLHTLCCVGELVNLEILICRYCALIEELPLEIKKLNRLKLLDLTECSRLQRIGRGIISSLVRLEELKMLGSFRKWEAEEREEKENAGLRELEALTNLRCLEILIEDPALAGENFHLSSKLEKFEIRLSDSFPDTYPTIHGTPYSKKLCLNIEKEIKFGPWIQMKLLPNTESLSLLGNGANNIDLAKIQNIKWLHLGSCETLKKIVRTTMDWVSTIEHLKLLSLPKLEKIWDGDLVLLNSFQNLKTLELRNLPALKNCGNYSFPQLEDLIILGCEMMEQVFLWQGESPTSHPITKMFPKLEIVRLHRLHNLNTFYQGIEGIEFPQLRLLSIQDCEKMTSIVSKAMGSNENNSGGSNIAHIQVPSCQSLEVSFGCLETLSTNWNPFHNHKIDISFFSGLTKFAIVAYEGSTSFITPSIVEKLVNLTILVIKDCDEMEHVIANDEKKGLSGGQRTLLQFPKLQELILSSSPKLVDFCEWKCDVELPSLRKVKIGGCTNMKNLTMGSLNAPNLESFETDMTNNLHLQVPFNNTKKLTISHTENPLNSDKIDVSHFNGLEELKIIDYKGSMGFFPSSIAGALVNLTSLTIESCDELLKVIEHDEEKDKVGSGGEQTTLFPNLQMLELECLSKLVTFCEWKCDIELPSLREVKIWRCKNVKRFTLGHLGTPNLRSVRIDYQGFDPLQDLNGLLQQVFEERKQEEDNDEEGEGGGEGLERMGEIVEEQGS